MTREVTFTLVGENLSDPVLSEHIDALMGLLAAAHALRLSRSERDVTITQKERWAHDPRGLTKEDFQRALGTGEAVMGKNFGMELASRAFNYATRWARYIDEDSVAIERNQEGMVVQKFLSRDGLGGAIENWRSVRNFGTSCVELSQIVLDYTYPAEEES